MNNLLRNNPITHITQEMSNRTGGFNHEVEIKYFYNTSITNILFYLYKTHKKANLESVHPEHMNMDKFHTKTLIKVT